jgi:ABC-type dipeptide/oligopeptide/nickel transport system permease subunit
VGGAIVALAALAAIFGPLLSPFDPAAQDLALRLEGPSGTHWFGLDELGRDILARVLSGARISLLVGLVVVGVSSVIGILLGSIAGYISAASWMKPSAGSSTSCSHFQGCSWRLHWSRCSARA